MKLSTRLAAAMIALVVLTAAAVGLLTYRNIEAAIVPRALERLGLEADLLAARLRESARSARADVVGFRAAVALEGIVRASLAGGVDPRDGTTLDDWRERMAKRYAAELAAKPLYAQFRIIGVADNGREVVRVDRAGPGGAIRIVPKAELQTRGSRSFFQEAIKLADGQVYVSPVELTREGDAVAVPHVPAVRVATPIHISDGQVFGIVVINLDLRPIFAEIRSAARSDARVFVVNEQGDYLVHPDPSREFGFELGTPHRLQDDFPGLAALLTGGGAPVRPQLVEDRDGERFGLAVSSVELAGGPLVRIVDAVPHSRLIGSTGAVRDASLVGGLVAVLCAVALALIIARSMTRPLVQLTRAVEGFGRGEPVAVPGTTGGELGVLVQAFTRMSKEVSERAAAMRRDAEIFDSIMTSMADAVLLVDERAALLFANPAARSLLAMSADTGWNDWQARYRAFQPDDTTPLAVEEWPMQRAAAGQSIDNLELAIRPAGEAKLTHIVLSARPIRGEAGAAKGAVLVFRDVTALKETERQLRQSQKLDAVGQLTGGVAHDFNNLLTVITGSIDFLAEGVADQPKLAAAARTIDAAATRGAELTQRLLAFARKQVLQPAATDVNTLVAEIAKLLRATLGEHVDIVSVLDPATSPALVDPSQLATALLNLAVNARDAMPGGGKLTLETANVTLDEDYGEANPEVVPGRYVQIAVTDSGSGIPAALRDKVFEPFFTTKEVGKGTGLGLSMAYGFAKQSGGHLKLYSEEGHGTTVRLYLPPAAEPGVHGEAAAAAPPILGGSETILVVEDDDQVRASVGRQLESLGYRTLFARTGAEALALADGGARFDLLFTDVIMPGMNGKQLADAMAARLPSVKVLYTSGYAENAIVHQGRLDAGVALLNKPYRKADLARKIREVLSTPVGGE